MILYHTIYISHQFNIIDTIANTTTRAAFPSHGAWSSTRVAASRAALIFIFLVITLTVRCLLALSRTHYHTILSLSLTHNHVSHS